MARVTFLGLGTMGRGMVANLLAAGHEVTVHNRSPQPVDEVVAAGATRAATIADAVRGADYVMYCLADDPAVEEVALGPGGVAESVDESSLVIDLSTISPELGMREHEAYAARGVRFLDAPVFGSRNEAANGGLWIVVGGREADLDAARPVLDPLAETVHHMGEAGSGHRMKLVGNLLVASQLHALGEALTLARKVGLDLEAVLDVLAVTDFRTPIYSGVGKRVVSGDHSPDFALHLMLKDLGLIAGMAADAGVELPTVEAATSAAQDGVAQGLGTQNASALITVLAERAGTDLTA